jgi:hypothetical protein
MTHDDQAQPTDADAGAFIAAIANETKREDSERVLRLMQTASGHAPVMWGTSVVGFGRNAAGGMLIGFAPRQRELVLYLGTGTEAAAEQLRSEPKVKVGTGCIFVKRMADVKPQALERAVKAALAALAVVPAA